MAWRAIDLIACGSAELIEAGNDGTRGTRGIDHLPIIDPLSLYRAVLNRKYMNVACRQSGCVGLGKAHCEVSFWQACLNFAALDKSLSRVGEKPSYCTEISAGLLVTPRR